jgi:UDP-GlcNAc:undecaprenyl-phosphate/decaprenyl-phosphate GlcNAc-1-phosphate transferase
MSRARFSFLISLVLAVVVVTWGFASGVQAQSPKTAKPQPKQGTKSGQATAAKSDQTPVLETQKDRVSYAIGVNMIGNLKMQGIEYDLDLLIRGMKDAASDGKLLMTDGELQKSIVVYHNELKRKQVQVKATAAAANKKEGEAFLAENKSKEGVVSLPSGLQYKIIKAGDGKVPTDADTVECHYRGTLINGTEFGSSHHTGNPATFKLSSVIPGWREALKLMPVGSTWQLFIPPELGYGERGSTGPIGPNATLVYEVELLGIK